MGTWRRLAALSGAAVLVVGAGCGDDADQADGNKIENQIKAGKPTGFEATPGYLSKVVDDTSGEAYRFEMDMSFGMMGETYELDGIATGEADGDIQHMTMDMGAMFDQMAGALGESEDMPEELTTGDMTIEYIVGPEDMYLRAPFFATLGDLMPAGEDLGEADALFEAFTSMGEGWGHVDLTALGDIAPGEAAGALGGGQTMDPQVFLDMIKDTEAVEDLGTDEIDGVEVSGLAADVSLGQLLEGQDMDASDLGASGDIGFPIEVWVDGEGQIRRVSFKLDEEALADAAGEEIDDMDVSDLGGFEFGMTMDFTDYGDASIEIEEPSGDDVVDITEDFVAGFEELSELSVDADSLTES